MSPLAPGACFLAYTLPSSNLTVSLCRATKRISNFAGALKVLRATLSVEVPMFTYALISQKTCSFDCVLQLVYAHLN